MSQPDNSVPENKIKWWEIVFAIFLPVPCLIYSYASHRPYSKKLLIIVIIAYVIQIIALPLVPMIMIWLNGGI